MSRLVLWGRRKGDVQYASRDFWRRNIPIGDGRLTLLSATYFDVGDMVEVDGAPVEVRQRVWRITGIDGQEVGVALPG